MGSLHRDMDRLFEGLWSEGFGSSLLPEVWARGEIAPQLDVTEDDKAFAVKVDLPGLDEKDVEVTLSDRLLTIRGEKKEDKETKEKNYYRRERAYGTFRRSIEIPAVVDATKIDASFKKGVLTIQLPKTKEAQQKVKQIEVKAA
jgi:HSP20 family protein